MTKAISALVIVLGLGYALWPETMKLSTLYPAPVAAYQRLVTTAQTILARDEGKVVIGKVSNPMEKLTVGGDAAFGGSVDMSGGKMTRAAEPTDPQDYATKAYVDRAFEPPPPPPAPPADTSPATTSPKTYIWLGQGAEGQYYPSVSPEPNSDPGHTPCSPNNPQAQPCAPSGASCFNPTSIQCRPASTSTGQMCSWQNFSCAETPQCARGMVNGVCQ